jgi:O-antigen/teichoic acid export membrane protein
MIKKKYNQHKETIHNFGWRSLQIFGKQGITFLIFILAAKMLSPHLFGIYNYVLAIIFFLIMFGDFGISTATSKYVAEYNVTDKDKLKAVLFNSGIIIFGLTLIITLLTLLFGKFYLGDKYLYVLYLLPLLFLSPMTSLYDGIYRGLKKFKQLAITSTIVGLLSLSFVYILIEQYGLIGALVAQNLFYFILFLALAFGYRELHFKINLGVMREIGNYAFIYGIAVIGYYLFARIDILILGHFGHINEIAIYELINKLFMILIIPFAIIGQVVAPNFSRDYKLRRYKTIYSKLKKYTLFFIVIAVLLSVLLYFIFPPLIKIFFVDYYGHIFNKIFPLVLIIFMIHVSASTVDHGIIIPTGYAKLMSCLYLILGTFNLILSLILLNIFGFIGVIYSTLISMTIMAVGLRMGYFRKIRKLI